MDEIGGPKDGSTFFDHIEQRRRVNRGLGRNV
jgi:hypothetical protein